MARSSIAYGQNSPLVGVFPAPHIASRNPRTNDTNFKLGRIWINESSNDCYILTSRSGLEATWTQIGDEEGELHTLSADSGSATPASNIINLAGGNNVTTSATGNAVTFDLNDKITLNETSASDPQLTLQRSGTTTSKISGTTLSITDTYQTIPALSGYTHGIFLILVAGRDNGQPVAAWIATRTSSTGTAIITALQSQDGTGLWVGKSLQLQWTGAGVAPQIKHDRAGNTLTDARIHTINLGRI